MSNISPPPEQKNGQGGEEMDNLKPEFSEEQALAVAGELISNSDRYRSIPAGREGRQRVQAMELARLAFEIFEPTTVKGKEAQEELDARLIRVAKSAQLHADYEITANRDRASWPPVLYGLAEIIKVANRLAAGEIKLEGPAPKYIAEVGVDDVTQQYARNIAWLAIREVGYA